MFLLSLGTLFWLAIDRQALHQLATRVLSPIFVKMQVELLPCWQSWLRFLRSIDFENFCHGQWRLTIPKLRVCRLLQRAMRFLLRLTFVWTWWSHRVLGLKRVYDIFELEFLAFAHDLLHRVDLSLLLIRWIKHWVFDNLHECFLNLAQTFVIWKLCPYCMQLFLYLYLSKRSGWTLKLPGYEFSSLWLERSRFLLPPAFYIY